MFLNQQVTYSTLIADLTCSPTWSRYSKTLRTPPPPRIGSHTIGDVTNHACRFSSFKEHREDCARSAMNVKRGDFNGQLLQFVSDITVLIRSDTNTYTKHIFIYSL